MPSVDDHSFVPGIVITGVGVCSPIGLSKAQVVESIRKARGAIGIIRAFDTTNQRVRHAAEILDYDPCLYFSDSDIAELDRTAQFAIVAVRQAIADAKLDLRAFAPERVGLVIGICAGGQGARPDQATNENGARGKAKQVLDTAHYVQTNAVGNALELHGPRATISTACASSGTALAYAYELLQARKVDVVLAGGADAFSFHTYAGFYALGAMAQEPCSPFSEGIGVTFGEGAGFVVLESRQAAKRRGAAIYGEFSGYGSTGDAYHITTPHPAGEGLRRAMVNALSMAGLHSGDIEYINAHGTGTRDNDTAETIAVKDLCRELSHTPPMSSTKSYFGHTLGAAGVLEFICSVLCQNEGIIPPTLNFHAPRSGCDLDYVPNRPRAGNIRHFLSSSAAFGGVNTVLVGSAVESPAIGRVRQRDGVLVTGIGIVSPVGCGVERFRAALQKCVSGVTEIDRFDPSGLRSHRAALLRDFRPRQLITTLDVRRMDRLNQFATVAAGLAFRDACLESRRIPDERIGVVTGLSRGPVSTQESFLESLRRDGLDGLSAKYFPSMVISTVGGQVSQALGLKALNSTLVDGAGAGLHAIIHAFEMLRQNDAQDALLVVAADEVGAMFFRLFDHLGILGNDLRLYDPGAEGTVLGEGAVALVLEREGSAVNRNARQYAKITGYGLTADSAGDAGAVQNEKWLARAMKIALEEAGIERRDIDFCYGLGRGLAPYDQLEIRSWDQIFGENPVPTGCVTGNTGFSEAASGAYGVAAALLGLRYGEVYALTSKMPRVGMVDFVQEGTLEGDYRCAMVAGGTENGNNAALVLERV